LTSNTTSTKTLKLDENLPDVMGCPTDFSLALSAMMRHVVRATTGNSSREIFMATGCEGGFVRMEVAFRATALRCAGLFVRGDR